MRTARGSSLANVAARTRTGSLATGDSGDVKTPTRSLAAFVREHSLEVESSEAAACDATVALAMSRLAPTAAATDRARLCRP
jgi:hypothetical protein